MASASSRIRLNNFEEGKRGIPTISFHSSLPLNALETNGDLSFLSTTSCTLCSCSFLVLHARVTRNNESLFIVGRVFHGLREFQNARNGHSKECSELDRKLTVRARTVLVRRLSVCSTGEALFVPITRRPTCVSQRFAYWA